MTGLVASISDAFDSFVRNRHFYVFVSLTRVYIKRARLNYKGRFSGKGLRLVNLKFCSTSKIEQLVTGLCKFLLY